MDEDVDVPAAGWALSSSDEGDLKRTIDICKLHDSANCLGNLLLQPITAITYHPLHIVHCSLIDYQWFMLRGFRLMAHGQGGEICIFSKQK